MKVNFNNVNIDDNVVKSYQDRVNKIVDDLESRKNKIDDFVGWLDVNNYDKNEINRIKQVSRKIRKQADVLLVIGIGGSYLGAKAVIDALKKDNSLEVIYVGNNLSCDYINSVVDYIKDKDFVINVISKSGTTLEPAISFRIFLEILEKRYSDSNERVYVVTDSKLGKLRSLANEKGYTTFNINANIGGRYSVLTAAQLLPIACMNIDIEKLLLGAIDAYNLYLEKDVLKNECYRYAIIRNIMYNNDKFIEILANYDNRLHYFSEWWKQLYGESEGKDGKGIFPANLDFTTDLHSMGQYIQEGRKNIFETVLFVNSDNLNYLVGKSINYINKMAMQGTMKAHVDGNVNNILIELDKLDEIELGKLIFFFEKACAISCMLLGVNPFNQPGVEQYKKNMFKLLGKPIE